MKLIVSFGSVREVYAWPFVPKTPKVVVTIGKRSRSRNR